MFCSFCNKHGHKKYFCFKRRDSFKKNTQFYNLENRTQNPKQGRDHSQNVLRNFFLKSHKHLPEKHHRNNISNNFKPFRESYSQRNTNPQGPKSLWVPKNLLNSFAGMSPNNNEQALVLGQWMLKAYDWRQE